LSVPSACFRILFAVLPCSFRDPCTAVLEPMNETIEVESCISVTETQRVTKLIRYRFVKLGMWLSDTSDGQTRSRHT
jgi:hypothetical protein